MRIAPENNNKETSSNFYDRCSYFYESWQSDFLLADELFAYVAELLQLAKIDLPKSCLDIGCASGAWVKTLEKAGCYACGVDSSVGILPKRQDGTVAKNFLHADCLTDAFIDKVKTCFKLEKWEMISAFTDVINHFDTGEVQSFFAAAAALLVDGGVLICDCLSAADFINRALSPPQFYDDGVNFSKWEFRVHLPDEAEDALLQARLAAIIDGDEENEQAEAAIAACCRELINSIDDNRQHAVIENSLLSFRALPEGLYERNDSVFSEYLHFTDELVQIAGTYGLEPLFCDSDCERLPWGDDRQLLIFRKVRTDNGGKIHF